MSLIKRKGNGGSIPEVTTDPVSPTAQQAWVLYTKAAYRPQTSLFPLGMALVQGTPATWKLSYKTVEGPIKRVTLT